MLRNKQITIKSNLAELHKLEAFVEQISDVYNVNSTYYSNILVALSEAVSNSIIHGNKENEDAQVIVSFEAKNKGIKFGRKRSVDRGKLKELREKGTGASAIARQMNIGRSTVYKIMEEMKNYSRQAPKFGCSKP